jgi:hypothetical protein
MAGSVLLRNESDHGRIHPGLSLTKSSFSDCIDNLGAERHIVHPIVIAQRSQYDLYAPTSSAGILFGNSQKPEIRRRGTK